MFARQCCSKKRLGSQPARGGVGARGAGEKAPAIDRGRGFIRERSRPHQGRTWLLTLMAATAAPAAAATPAHADKHANDHQDEKYQRKNPEPSGKVPHVRCLLWTGRMRLPERYRARLWGWRRYRKKGSDLGAARASGCACWPLRSCQSAPQSIMLQVWLRCGPPDIRQAFRANRLNLLVVLELDWWRPRRIRLRE